VPVPAFGPRFVILWSGEDLGLFKTPKWTNFACGPQSIGGIPAKMDDEMIITLRSVVYAAILLVTSVYSLTAKGDDGPSYGSGPTVFVPFVNAMDLSNPSNYVSPLIKVGFNSPNNTGFNVTMDTGSVGIIVGSSYFSPPGTSDPSFIGQGTETLTSSGFMYTGDWYETTVI
jgi:hypothetical protein